MTGLAKSSGRHHLILDTEGISRACSLKLVLGNRKGRQASLNNCSILQIRQGGSMQIKCPQSNKTVHLVL
jgi:hypothetical protein